MADNEVERLLEAVAGDSANMPAFLDALVAADVYGLGTWETHAGDAGQSPRTVARLLTWTLGDGEVTAFFSSEAMMHATLAAQPGTDQRSLRLPCRAFLELTRGSRLVLNPHGPYGKMFSPEDAAALLAGE